MDIENDHTSSAQLESHTSNLLSTKNVHSGLTGISDGLDAFKDAPVEEGGSEASVLRDSKAKANPTVVPSDEQDGRSKQVFSVGERMYSGKCLRVLARMELLNRLQSCSTGGVLENKGFLAFKV